MLYKDWCPKTMTALKLEWIQANNTHYLVAQGIHNYIGVARMTLNRDIVLLQQQNLSVISQIKIPLFHYMLKATMAIKYLTTIYNSSASKS